MQYRRRPLLVAVFLAFSGTPFSSSIHAGETITTPDVEVASEKLRPLPSLTNTEIDESALARLRTRTSDTAMMLDGHPGISLYGAGGVSSLPSIHGLADDRLRIKVDGMDLVSACANHMNPPLSYIDPAHVVELKVFAGITPVSLGGDSIGGTIAAESAAPEFAKPGAGMLTKGGIGTFYRSNNHARGINLSATVAGERFSARYTGSLVDADNYRAGDDFKRSAPAPGPASRKEVGSSYYRAENHALAFALQQENHLLELKLGFQNIPEQGFPNQRMDMTDNDSHQVNLRYSGQYDWGQLVARAWHERTRHKMNFGEDKVYWYSSMMGPVAGMPMETEGRNTGFALKGDIVLTQRDILRLGAEYQRYRLDDWWDPVANAAPMMGPGTFWNINNGQRDRYAAFAEWEARWSAEWATQLGLRHETVSMDADPVQGYSSSGMMSYGNPASPASIPGAFNAADRSETDRNFDLTALASFKPSATSRFEAGYAMKTRSPNLYERYTWSYNNSMVMNMNNWFGDGNGYVGNLGLHPEIAHTFGLSGDWHDAAGEQWQLKLAPFYTHVTNYIDAVACSTVGKACPVRVDGFSNLTLANQTARLYGADLSGKLSLGGGDWGRFDLRGVMSYVRGKNLDSDDDLYNIMPLNLRLALDHRLGAWQNTLESRMVARKDQVESIRNERETPGFALLNYYSSYTFKQARLDFGIENVFDRKYYDPLGGAYLGQGATMGTGVSAGTRVPGMGRSINIGLAINF